MPNSILDTLGRTKDALKLQPDERAAQQKLEKIEIGREQMGKLCELKATAEERELQAQVPNLLQRIRRAAAIAFKGGND